MTRQGQRIGRLADIIIDINGGRVAEVILRSGRFLGTPDELSAVPPQVLRFDDERNVLTLDTTREELGGAPHFSDRVWPQLNGAQVTEVYQAYHVVPYFLPLGRDGTARNSTASDVEITGRIEKEILNTAGLSVEARNVKVATVEGRVTLSGAVANLAEKRELGQIAARVVPAANVDNRLEVKETASN
jgi:hypothetical protein